MNSLQSKTSKFYALKEKGCDTDEKLQGVLQEIATEIHRRRSLGDQYLERRQVISSTYKPRHPQVFQLKEEFFASEFLDLVRYCKTDGATLDGVLAMVEKPPGDRLYSFPVFTLDFCSSLTDELEHFEASDCPRGRPNTMNNYGILLNELGFDEDFLNPLRVNYLTPICAILFPDWGGSSLDSHKAFVVMYKPGEDVDLSYHYDNSEVTLNVALSSNYAGGSLYFGNMRTESSRPSYTEYSHRATVGVVHRGQHRHGANAIQSGERYNLIIWMRSSRVRNQLCPMCDSPPELVETVGFGDGFTNGDHVVDVCITL
ncbi:2-oxoglutarate and iron-dependent oxygenase domain-containing protein 2-like isoform X2 [Gigantopelta aegis]|uniref:2-oxoglutarate and iron-dependent oxygenase domain-containing protein 2-like isoform X2 n=1 Tax=Gigantopelta aegis TaxID=1735272 RepID=UPI001B889FFD|nr:2-oxoglutarate and iron-dependent oxygenase domain-containing protein 2-like isoform X2 [Gigantopelta aegis]